MSHQEFKISEPIESQEASPMQEELSVFGIAMAQRVLHAVGMDATGKIVLRQRVSRHALMPLRAKLPPVRIGIEGVPLADDTVAQFHYRITQQCSEGAQGGDETVCWHIAAVPSASYPLPALI
jgi:hypothetical protein